MNKVKNKYTIIIVLLVLIMVPNIVFVWLGADSAVTSIIKQVVFLVYSLSLVLLPLSVVKPKWFFILLSPFIPFALLDLYVLNITETQSTTMHYYSFIATNYNEAMELISGNILYVLFSVVFFGIYFFLVNKLEFTSTINKKVLLVVRVVSMSVITVLLLRDIKIAYSLSRHSMVEATAYHFFIKLDKTFPFGVPSKMFDVYKDIERVEGFNDRNKNFSYESTIFNNDDRTIVLVIGETARRNNFQIYGYGRDNNPYLTKEKNVIPFSNFTTNSNFTLTSVSQIITSVGPKTYSKAFEELGIISAFKEAGYQTYWITNQSYSYGSSFNLFAKSADYFVDVSASLEMSNNDLVILPHFKDNLKSKSKKKLIVIHAIGSHYRYNLRYPKEFAKYKPELDNSISVAENSEEYRSKYVNSYDNSILLTDYFLSELNRELKNSNDNFLMIYLSDHGENLFDDDKGLFLHGSSMPSKFELEIPMFIWHSEGYSKEVVDKIKYNKNKKLSSEIIFHTMCSMGGFYTKLHNIKYDLLSDSLVNSNRYFLRSDRSVMEVD